MTWRALLVHVMVALLGGLVGAWIALPSDEAAPPPVPTPIAASGLPGDARPLIAVASDGTVTLRVEQQPLDWVLEQIARQAGPLDTVSRSAQARQALPASAAVPLARPPTGGPAALTPSMQAVFEGSDEERQDRLLQLRPDVSLASEASLRWLYENDPSDRVRSIAFQKLLEARAGNPEQARQLLEAGLTVPNAAVQAEARRRLDSLLNGEGLDTGVQ